ncbi:hypothetical protein EV06_1628 [Prochlorococcus sp. MIT 0602]|nr:hypothetical protein EV06_1628 [Prochlorococcus sp. MIT 0602]KGG16003.1 hypothetical protein EV07_1970 [Prochlorococcus sp. MIT 0603]
MPISCNPPRGITFRVGSLELGSLEELIGEFLALIVMRKA